MPHFCGQHRRWKNNAVASRRYRAQKEGYETSDPTPSPISPESTPPRKPVLLEACLDIIKLRNPFASCLGRKVREDEPVVRRGILKAPTEHFNVVDALSTETRGGQFLDMKRVRYSDVVKVSYNGPFAAAGSFSCN